MLPIHVGTALPASQTPAARMLTMFLSGKSPHTIRAYNQDLSRLAKYLGVGTVGQAAEALLVAGQSGANALALGFRNHLLDVEKRSPATINRALTSLCSMVKVGRLVGAATWTLDVVRVEAQTYRDTRGPGREVIEKMLGTLGEDQGGLRDRAIISLLYNRGLRRGEVASLDVQHFDAKNRTVSVMGKRRRERETLGLPETSVAAISAWLRARPAPTSPTSPLFCSLDQVHSGGRLTGEGIRYIIGRIGDWVGVKVKPHGLRHTAITDVLDRSDGNTRKGQRFSRHRSADTLNIYDDNRQDFGKEMADLLEAK